MNSAFPSRPDTANLFLMRSLPRPLLSALALLLPALVSASDSIVFKRHGKPVATLEGDAIRNYHPSVIEVDDPAALEKIRYEAVPFRSLLSRVYGHSWKKEEEILFTCSDGFQPSIPVKTILEYTPALAFRREGADFEILNRAHGKEDVKLGPYYLIWDNLNEPKVKTEGGEIWPYQLTTIDIIRFEDRFPRLTPPKGAGASAKRGFLVFRKNCMSCHTMNGEGGTRGVELNYPVNVTRYFKTAWLERWIDDPRSVRFSTTMPAISKDLPKRKRKIADVIEYLKAMDRRKIKPKPVSLENQRQSS